jgi:hypothetical protein
MDNVRGPTGAGHPLAKSSLRGGRTERLGRNPNSGQPMLAPGDHGPGSSSVLLRNPEASEQRYTDPHGVDPVHGGAGQIDCDRAIRNHSGEESLAQMFRRARRNELLCRVADLVAQN